MESLQQLCFGPFRFDPVNQCLWQGEQVIDLAPKAFAVLSYLLTHPGRLVTKEELLQAVWPDVFVTDAVLKVRVREVRKALSEQAQAPQFIETLHRRGYRFMAKVTPVLDAADEGKVAPQQPPSANALVGRDSVVAQLHEHLQRARQGTRQIVFVTGEAGMGKTAVVDAFLEQANSQSQVLMASGQCVEHYGTGEAYLPMLQALSRLSRQAGAEKLPELLRQYAPTWLAQLPWLIEDAEHAPLQHEILGSNRTRMMREMGELCGVLARELTLVLVLEDLHWSDYATLDLLSWLARQREPARLLVLGTYRPVELILHDHPLKAVKQELQLHRQCNELALDFLNNAEVAEFLHRIFPAHAFPDQLAHVIHRRTDGNPLFLVNVVDYLRSQGMLAEHTDGARLTVELAEVQAALPQSLQLMIDKQLDRLTVEQQHVLAGASIAGAEFTVAAVAAGIAQDIVGVEECCEEWAQTQQFFRPLGAEELPDGTVTERYAFIHTLYQDVLCRRLPATRRTQLQRAIGLQKEAAYTGRTTEIAAELALHFEQGGELQRAVDYLRQAASNARYRYANRAALSYLTRALQLLEKLSVEEQTPLRLQLLEDCGHIRRSMADMLGAAEDFSKLLTYAQEWGLVDWEIAASLHLATVMSWIDRERCLTVVSEIHNRCDSMENSLTKAYARGWCGYWNLLWRHWDEPDAEACAAAVAAARRAGQREQLSPLLGRYSFFQSLRSDYRAAGETAAEGLQLALETGDASEYLLTLFFRAWALLHKGEWDTLYQLLHDDGLRMAEKNEHHLWILLFQLQLAGLAEEAFSFEIARELSERAVVQATRSDLPYGRLLGSIRMGFAQLGSGQLQPAYDCFRTSAEWLARERVLMDWILKIPLHLGLSRYWLASGDYRQASEEAATVCSLAAVPGERSYMALGHNTLAEIAVAEHDQQQAQNELKRAMAVLEGAEVPLAQWRVYATAAELADSLGNHAEAEQYWTRSATILNRLAARLESTPELRRTFLNAAPVRAILSHVPAADSFHRPS